MSLGPEWKYHVTINHKDWEEVAVWCQLNIGTFDQDWYKLGIDIARYIIDGDYRTTWYFKQEYAASMFVLKWA